MADYIYVCMSSSGEIKVGRSRAPLERIASHKRHWAKKGFDLSKFEVAECEKSSAYSEQMLINLCIESASSRCGKEWFLGLDYKNVTQWMHECSKSLGVKTPKKITSEYGVCGSLRLPVDTWMLFREIVQKKGSAWLVKIILREHRKTFGETK